MNAPLISIIVPVFNAKNTIKKCLDSFMSQTLSKWELILVDDGSTDESGKICDEYVMRDARFRVFHQENAGVSAARQTGLNASTGEYVIHADPDDWVEPDMLAELFKTAVAEDADMVICDWIAGIDGRDSYIHQRPTSLQASDVLNNIFDGTLHGSCWNKLVKRSCIDLYEAHFPDGINYCEDVCFNVQLLIHDIKVVYLNKAFYHYIQLPSSITNHYTLESLEAHKRYVRYLESCLPENSFPILTSKEFVKKLAFRHAILNDIDFKHLYPEIKVSHDRKWILRLMYNLAFSGHFLWANIMRKGYLMLHEFSK